MLFNFLPNEVNFFDLFEKQVGYAVAVAKEFKEMVSTPSINEASLSKIQAIEHNGDDAAHAIFDQLNKSFITPFDREDIYRLAKELDDIIDMVNTISSRLLVYRLTGLDKNMVEFANVIEESVRAVDCAVKGMRSMKHSKSVMESCVEINRLENVGDSMRDRMLGKLFDTERDPIAVIKWKEIYQESETVLDICEDVAHVVESILLKQA